MPISERDQEQTKRFGPSKFSADGFLGADTRKLEEIIAADKAAVESLGSTCDTIATLLTLAFDSAEAALGNSVELKPGVTATHNEARGKIPSPFRGDGVFQKGEVAVTEAESGKTIFITRLGNNLIGRHGFFQGRGSRYRIEPEDALRMCG